MRKVFFTCTFILLCTMLITTSCMKIKVKDYASKICNENYEVEAYTVYPFSVYEIYLVGRNGKRSFILKYDIEQDYVKDTCMNDSIEFVKYKENQSQYPNMYYEVIQKVIFDIKTSKLTTINPK